MKTMTAAIVALAFLLFVQVSVAADPSQLVKTLPGQPPVSFGQYAGYVTVDAAAERELFYWFYEANKPNRLDLPLAVWFSGGPGCSSVGAGALSELGPFRTSDDGQSLVMNKFAWNEAANIIFVESPFGVGFSQSKTQSEHGDEETATDAQTFIVEWLKKFPEYAKNELYLLGESYAGHYVPTLAVKLLANKNLNFKGFAIGNPLTEDRIPSAIDFSHSHNMISDETYNDLLECRSGGDQSRCDAGNAAIAVDGKQINPYNIYAPACNAATPSTSSLGSPRKLLASRRQLEESNPCVDSVTKYLNLPAVKAALHANVDKVWSKCSDMQYRPEDASASMVPLYKDLVTSGLRIWIYSGDLDGMIPTMGTRQWIKKLNLPIKAPWYAWNYGNQVAGWAEEYAGLTFTTIRGAGHFVPYDKPEASLEMFRRFLAGGQLQAFTT